MAGLRKSETRTLIKSLERQGGRVEYATSGGGFPVKVWPPDGGHFILVHQTLSDYNSITLKRADVQRAGMVWPFDDKKATKLAEKISRKENTMSAVKVTTSVDHTRKPGEHLVVPPGARNRKYPPTKSSVEQFSKILDQLPETFWTAQATAVIQASDIPGYGGKASGAPQQRVQSMLDWLGYRVVETEPNRGGFSYRWIRDPAAEAKEGVDAPSVAPKHGEEPKAAEPTVAPLPAQSGPVAAAFAEAQRRKAEDEAKRPRAFVPDPDESLPGFGQPKTPESGETAKDRKVRERVECPDCHRHFTPEGYQRHAEDNQHGEYTPKPTALTPEDARLIASHPVVQEAIASTKLDGETFAVEGPLMPLDTVARADYEAMEQLAQEAERRASEANTELGVRDADIELLNRELAQARTSATADLVQYQDLLAAARTERDEAKRQAQIRDEQNARQAATIGDLNAQLGDAVNASEEDSWVLEVEPLRLASVQDVIADAAKFGIAVEIRGRRA